MNFADVEMPARLLTLKAAALDPANAGQWLLIAVAVLSGLVIRHLIRRTGKVPAREVFPDLLMPVAALVLLGLGWRILFRQAPAPLLHLAVALLLALSVARLGARLVRTLLQSQIALGSRWERLIARTVWVLFVLHVLGVLDAALDLLEELSLPVGDHHVSVLRILQGVLMIGLALVLSLWLGRVLERRIMGVDTLDASLRVISTKLLRGVLLAFAVLFTLPLIGVDITFLSVLGGALGVGLGFGLQKIASNYVSGFIILLDRSVRLSDVITVDGRRGLVSHMEARYTVLKGSDGTETIIPNETFVTATVINHTLNDRSGSVGFPLWLDHEADVHRAIEALEGLLKARPEIMTQPAPAAQLSQMTDIGLELQVSWLVADMSRNDPAFRAAMLLAALDTLRAHGVRLARRPAGTPARPDGGTAPS